MMEASTSTHEALEEAARVIDEAQAQVDSSAEASEAIAEAAVEIAAIEGDTQIALAEINAETAEATAEIFAEENARINVGSDETWQRELAETRERLGRLESLITELALKMGPPKTQPSLSIQQPSGDLVVETLEAEEAPIVEPITSAEKEGEEGLEKAAEASEPEIVQVRKKRGRWLR